MKYLLKIKKQRSGNKQIFKTMFISEKIRCETIHIYLNYLKHVMSNIIVHNSIQLYTLYKAQSLLLFY